VPSERCSSEEPSRECFGRACQLSISQKTLGTLPEDGNVMSKHVGATIHNYKTELITGVFVNFTHWGF
jgi:hypothetical protein